MRKNRVARTTCGLAIILSLGRCSAADCTDDADCDQDEICGESVCEDGEDLRFDLALPESRLIYRNDTGQVDIYDASGNWIVRGASALAMFQTPDGREQRARVSSEARRRQVEMKQEQDRLGSSTRIVVTAAADGEPDLVWNIAGYPADGFYTFQLTVTNDTNDTARLTKAATLRLDGANGGGLYLGDHPSSHRILENGSYVYMDPVVEIRTGDTPLNDALANAFPGEFAGHSVSNWNHAVKDLASTAAWISGSLSFESSSPVFNLSYDQANSRADPSDRQSFSFFSAEAAYLPEPKPIAGGDSFSTETIYVHPTEDDALDGLESYATAIKKHQEIVLWTEKSSDHRVPNGWNSWTGSGSTGGYGTDIDEQLMLANLDVMANELRDWGMDWFQVDDGYEPAYGDWTWNRQRFPHGPRWLSDQIRQRGLKPGLWIAPLTPHPTSTTAREHPDWLADKTPYGALLASGYELLDLTHPEVKTWLRDLFRTFRQDWNFDWLKMDFAYWALTGTGFSDPTRTREEAYRDALRIIREEIGDDTFFLAVAVMGIHYGMVDADRITSDNAPVWDWDPGVSDKSPLNQLGFKPTVRTTARRYFLHNRVWINHPDLIIFRSNMREPTWPQVTLGETQAFCTFVGLSGGIVKLGDKLVDLTAEQINTVRKLLPIYPKGARPLDLFVREFPEVWHEQVDGGTDGYNTPYDLVGIIHWGRNWDLSTNPFTEIPDTTEARAYAVSFADVQLASEGPYLAYEFWTESFLGEVTDALELDVPAHTGRVVALRKKMGRPQFLGWNRQITMGGTDIRSVTWNDGTATLELNTEIAKPTVRAPFTYNLAFYLPAGYRFKGASYSGAPVESTEETVQDKLLRVRFVPRETGAATLTLSFDKI